MKIAEIKSHLRIETVLAHYGLRPDRHHRLQCPFHPDKTPSLQIYPQTNTYCCFSSNCQAGTGDVIQFIGLMEHCSKHEALIKAATLVQGAPVGAAAARGLAQRFFPPAHPPKGRCWPEKPYWPRCSAILKKHCP